MSIGGINYQDFFAIKWLTILSEKHSAATSLKMFSKLLLLVLVVVIFEVHVIISKSNGGGFDVQEFKRNWCRQRKAALDWRRILEPCKMDMEYSTKPKSVNLT